MKIIVLIGLTDFFISIVLSDYMIHLCTTNATNRLFDRHSICVSLIPYVTKSYFLFLSHNFRIPTMLYIARVSITFSRFCQQRTYFDWHLSEMDTFVRCLLSYILDSEVYNIRGKSY